VVSVCVQVICLSLRLLLPRHDPGSALPSYLYLIATTLHYTGHLPTLYDMENLVEALALESVYRGLNYLPLDVLICIIKYLEVKDVIRLRQVRDILLATKL
jgi:hypothetical protein